MTRASEAWKSWGPEGDEAVSNLEEEARLEEAPEGSSHVATGQRAFEAGGGAGESSSSGDM